MSVSRAELVYSAILAAYQGITTGGGYRTDPNISSVIRPSDQMTAWPEIGIEMGQGEVEIEGWTTNNSGYLDCVVNEYIPVYVVGTVKADMDSDGSGTLLKAALDALLHDMKRVTLQFVMAHINDSTGALKWNITTENEKAKLKFDVALGLGKNNNMAKCATTFTVKIRNEGSDFSS